MIPALQSLTREQRELLACLRDDLWTVAGSPELAAAVAAVWLGREPSPTEVRSTVARYLSVACELAELDAALGSEAVAS